MSHSRRWTPEDLDALQQRRSMAHVLGPCSNPANVLAPVMGLGATSPAPKPTKYRNQPIKVDGERWDSRWEYECWRHLRLRERAGEIRSLRRQVAYELHAEGIVVGRIVVDFDWRMPDGCLRVADAKSAATRTPLFRWKAKHLKAEYGFEIELMERPQ